MSPWRIRISDTAAARCLAYHSLVGRPGRDDHAIDPLMSSSMYARRFVSSSYCLT